MLIVFISIIWISQACPLTPDHLPGTMSCINVLACSPTNSSNSIAIYQNCNGSWYNYTASSGNVVNPSLLRVPGLSAVPATNYPKTLQMYWGLSKATNIKLIDNISLISSNQQLLYYNLLQNWGYNISLNCNFTDFDAVVFSNGSQMGIILCPNQIYIEFFNYITQSLGIQLYHNFSNSDNFVSIKCIQNSTKCLIGTQNGNLVLYDFNLGVIEDQIIIDSNLSLTHIQYIYLNQNVSKIYTTNLNGTIKQYLYNTSKTISSSVAKVSSGTNSTVNSFLPSTTFIFQRYSSLLEGISIFQFMSTTDDQFLLATDTNGNIFSYNLSSGLLTQQNLGSNMSNKSNMAVSMVMSSSQTLFWYNSANSIVSYLNINSSNNYSLNSSYPMLVCLNMNYYNQTQQLCMPCNQNCSSCDPYTGGCLTCIDGYFNKDNNCLSCYYQPQSLTNYMDICFSGMEKGLMQSSTQIVHFMLVILSNFANFLNVCGILFLFLKLINNWNILSIYFFLPINNMPFFMSNILIIMFKAFNSSVFQAIGIHATFGLDLGDRSNNYKFQLGNVTTDFFAFTSEAFILYIYSVVLILTVYKAINYGLSKCQIQIFEDNPIMSFLQQFVATFTTTLLPIYYMISGPNSGFNKFQDRINSFCFYILFGMVIIIPFFYLNLKKARPKKINMKITNVHDKKTKEILLKSQINSNASIWFIEQNIQNLLYALLSFSIPLLACNSSPIYFFIVVSVIHILSLINLIHSSKRKKNNIFQKLLFILFHICFILLYVIDNDGAKLTISIFAVFILIIEGLHEMISSICKKIHFIYIVIRGKIQESKKNKAYKQQQTSNNKPKKHVIILHHNIQNSSNNHSLKLSKFKAKTTTNLQVMEMKEVSNINNSKISEGRQQARGKTAHTIQQQQVNSQHDFKSFMTFRQIRR